jgi:drug/metabolite transporter (DMT)-like permease
VRSQHDRCTPNNSDSCVGIAIAPILVRVSEVDPTTTLWLRMLLASVVLFRTGQWHRGGPSKPLSVGALCCLLTASVAFALDLLSFHLAVVRTSVANTALLGNISPIIVIPLAYLLGGERQTLRAAVGLAVALAGVTLLVDAGHALPDGGRSIIGDALAALSGPSTHSIFSSASDLRGASRPSGSCFGTASSPWPYSLQSRRTMEGSAFRIAWRDGSSSPAWL